MLPILLVSLATFNLRGLGDELKQSYLDQDCIQYNLDVIALQETKIKESYEHVFPESGNKLFVFDQTSSCWQRGIGFLISKRMLPCVTKVKQVSDNIAYIEGHVSLVMAEGAFPKIWKKHIFCYKRTIF